MAWPSGVDPLPDPGRAAPTAHRRPQDGSLCSIALLDLLGGDHHRLVPAARQQAGGAVIREQQLLRRT